MHQLRVHLFLVALAATTGGLPLCGGALRPAGAQTQQTQKLAVSGVVLDAHGQPVAGATIVLLPRGLINTKRPPALSVQSDGAGRFAGEVQTPQPPKAAPSENLAAPAPGQTTSNAWRVPTLVYAPGYALQSSDLGPKDNKITLERGVVASGRVKDTNGQPVVGALVRAQYIQLPNGDEENVRPSSFINLDELPAENLVKRAFEAVTDASGTWMVRDLPAGSSVYFNLADARFVSKSAHVPLGATREQAPTAAPDFIATPGASVSGRVLFPDGRPVVDATITAVSSERGQRSAQARSGPDGTFLLVGLSAGKAGIQVSPPSEAWAPAGMQDLTLTTTTTLRAPDIILTPGIAISGTVSDSETKLPLAGARVIAEGPFGSAVSSISDAQGRYTVRTVTGENRFYVTTYPQDYVRNWDAQITKPILETSTIAPDFALRRGVTLTGTALDEAGQPAVGATISSGSLFEGIRTVVDDKGAWTLHGVDPRPSRFSGNPRASNGMIALQSSGVWEITSGGTVSATTTTPVALTLRRVALQDVTARVTSTDGTPVAGATVRISILFDPRRGARRMQSAVTNAAGEVVLRNLRPDERAEITPLKEGYTLVKAGVVAALDAKNVGARATDAVLTPLDVTVRGRVVDANGAAVAGARVAPIFPVDLRLYPLASSDKEGQFALDKLPDGPLTVAAAFGRQWGRLEIKAPTKDTLAGGQTTITLSAPESVVPGRALDATFGFLDDWKVEGGKGSYSWGQMVAQFAVYDSDRALQLLKGAGGSLDPNSFTTALYELLERDPARAKAWAETYLDRLDDTRNTQSLWLSIAVATIEADPAGARKIYDRFAPGVVADKTGLSDLRQYALLGAIAGRLDLPEASKWQTSLDAAFAKLSADDQAFRVGSYVNAAAQADLPGAERMLAKMSPTLQVRALEEMIPIVARRDIPTAQRLLEQMEVLVAQPNLPVPEDRNDAMYRPKPMQSLNKARDAIVIQLLKTDPQAAYEQAKKVTEDGYGRTARRAEIAARLPAAQAVPLLLEEFEAARTSRYGDPAGEMSRIAALMMPFDAKQGEAMFAQARALLKPDSRFGAMEDFGPRATAYAFYRGPFDPAESRLLLENEWRRLYNKLRQGREEARKSGLEPNRDAMSNTYEQMIQDTVWAMVPASLDRAAEMQQELSVLKASSGFYRNNVVVWLLATDAARARLSFRNPLAE